MAKEQPQEVYVGFSQTGTLRKNILEALKQVIHGLQTYERLRPLREEKSKKMNDLEVELAKIAKLSNKLNTFFPRSRLKDIMTEQKKAENELKLAVKDVLSDAPIKGKVKKVAVEEKEISALERELSAIEAKLSNLG